MGDSDRGETKMNAPSYVRCICGSDCDWDKHNKEQPCWGEVNTVEKLQCKAYGFTFIHACEGHRNACIGGTYKPRGIQCQS